MSNFANTKGCKKAEKWLKPSVSAIQWIPTCQGLYGFQKSLHPCDLDESISLSIGRVHISSSCIFHIWWFMVGIVRSLVHMCRFKWFNCRSIWESWGMMPSCLQVVHITLGWSPVHLYIYHSQSCNITINKKTNICSLWLQVKIS